MQRLVGLQSLRDGLSSGLAKWIAVPDSPPLTEEAIDGILEGIRPFLQVSGKYTSSTRLADRTLRRGYAEGPTISHATSHRLTDRPTDPTDRPTILRWRAERSKSNR